MRALVSTILILMGFCAAAQNVQDQFEELKESSETFKDYKVIKIEKLNGFWSGVTDSLAAQQEEIGTLKTEINQLNSRISVLDTEVATARESEEAALYNGEHIAFLGIDFGKTTFTILFVAITVILLIVIAIGFFRLKERATTANKKIVAYDKLHDEYEEYKKNALEKQMKLRRELQTERNKLAENRSV